MEKTFREVIRDIKEGEVWETCANNNLNTIYMQDGYIGLEFSYEGTYFINVRDNENQAKYRLRRNKYTFSEAFEAYEEGKEIISVVTNYCYKNTQDGNFYKRNTETFYKNHNNNFSIDEIRGEWYIEGK